MKLIKKSQSLDSAIFKKHFMEDLNGFNPNG